ncbi:MULTISPECIES: glycoside hydrolase N-terminal domain-containing protein [unclassified Roseateles]|uniref:glycoside hydrolase family 95 protein n=1 Tax=unclassified Roseateles TaxID=2626991 RepID=UPI0007011838|nr:MULTISPECIES: glycoside hydrolase family 95 protein [unclassified Roseateles]KQW49773.1 alpha/beta hydrolase [Pelomonas sp. Root405]KRA76440.1 alpha/beta hydrolase [Pelomonas sp. Root662]
MTDFNPTRRSFVAGTTLASTLAALPAFARSGAAQLADDSLTLWYDRAAGPWIEALPIGSGRLGTMVFGRPAQERLQFNIDTLYGGGPYVQDNPKFSEALPKVRALIDEERWKEANALVSDSLMGKPIKQMPFSGAGDLLLDFPSVKAAARYRRSLDLDSAIATTTFIDGGGRHRREAFCSVPDQVTVIRLEIEGDGTIDLDLGYRHPDYQPYGGFGDTKYDQHGVVFVGAPWDHRESHYAEKRPSTLTVRADGSDALLIEGRNVQAFGIPGQLRYALRVQAIGDGRIEAAGDRLRVRGARQLTLLVSGETSYVNWQDTSGDPVAAVRQRIAAAARKPFAKLRDDHLKAHRALFRRLHIDLGGHAANARPTHARIAGVPREPDAALTAMYVQYARYLLLSSSRPGSQPANLQGVWNEVLHPPWEGKYTININTEMNYWPAGPANLDECVEPLLKMVEDLAVTGARTARNSYGARGWVAHHNTDLWRATAPIDGPLWGMWPTGGAWLCTTLWQHYQFNPSPALLRRLVPLFKGASLFFLDTLIEDPKGRGLVTSPSSSPENNHHADIALCAGPAMDRQILRDLFDAALAAQAQLGQDDPAFTAAVRKARARLPADRIGAQGQLQEWLGDWDASATDQQHRHVSHLYAVYPSEQVNVRDTPALAQAARVTLNARGDESTGWATAWRLALWTRLGDGERAYKILQGLLGPARTYPNLFDAHPPFQIDGNFGGAAAILDMIVQSWGGEVHLLAALPKAWPDGRLHGARAHGGVELDVDWQAGRLTRVRLRGPAQASVALRYRGQRLAIKLDARGHARLGGEQFTAAT